MTSVSGLLWLSLLLLSLALLFLVPYTFQDRLFQFCHSLFIYNNTYMKVNLHQLFIDPELQIGKSG